MGSGFNYGRPGEPINIRCGWRVSYDPFLFSIGSSAHKIPLGKFFSSFSRANEQRCFQRSVRRLRLRAGAELLSESEKGARSLVLRTRYTQSFRLIRLIARAQPQIEHSVYLYSVPWIPRWGEVLFIWVSFSVSTIKPIVFRLSFATYHSFLNLYQNLRNKNPFRIHVLLQFLSERVCFPNRMER